MLEMLTIKKNIRSYVWKCIRFPSFLRSIASFAINASRNGKAALTKDTNLDGVLEQAFKVSLMVLPYVKGLILNFVPRPNGWIGVRVLPEYY